jgi:hypothetical protein
MLEKILRLYVMAMTNDVRSPLPHIVGPPGCGKSTAVEQAAKTIGVNLHIINVSRLSPLEVEGVQMPHGTGEEMLLRMLPATFWTQLREKDILLLDEFLRGFPEVYNALLDILTSRRVGGFYLPKVFIIGASNSTVAYDKALEDRLLHIPVDDIRTHSKAKKNLAKLIVEELGLLPEMYSSFEMGEMIDAEVKPMYDMLDQFKNGKSSSTALTKGHSPRNLIGQAQLREVQSSTLVSLITANNTKAMRAGKPQYVVLLDGKAKSIPNGYVTDAAQLQDSKKLSEVQRKNLNLNLQLIEMESIRNEPVEGGDDDVDDIFNL